MLVDVNETEFVRYFQQLCNTTKEIAVRAPPEAEQLVDWRSRKLVELQPVLNRMKIFRRLRRVAARVTLKDIIDVLKVGYGLQKGP